MDIQGAELTVLHHAGDRLDSALVIQTEVEFLPMYVDQPLFSDVDQFLRERGFVLHRFFPTVSRMIKPLLVNNNPMAGMSQLVWADAVFIRDFSRPESLEDSHLLKMAALVHSCYQSFDLALYLLREHDRRNNGHLGDRYMEELQSLLRQRRSPSLAKPPAAE